MAVPEKVPVAQLLPVLLRVTVPVALLLKDTVAQGLAVLEARAPLAETLGLTERVAEPEAEAEREPVALLLPETSLELLGDPEGLRELVTRGEALRLCWPLLLTVTEEVPLRVGLRDLVKEAEGVADMEREVVPE